MQPWRRGQEAHSFRPGQTARQAAPATDQGVGSAVSCGEEAAAEVGSGNDRSIVAAITIIATIIIGTRGRLAMNVGKPQREIYVEPLQLPEPLRTEPAREPASEPMHEPSQPAREPAREPAEEPAHV